MLKKMDMYGDYFKHYLEEEQTTFKTRVGGIAPLLLCILTIAISAYLIYDWQVETVTIVTDQIFVISPKPKPEEIPTADLDFSLLAQSYDHSRKGYQEPVYLNMNPMDLVQTEELDNPDLNAEEDVLLVKNSFLSMITCNKRLSYKSNKSNTNSTSISLFSNPTDNIRLCFQKFSTLYNCSSSPEICNRLKSENFAKFKNPNLTYYLDIEYKSKYFDKEKTFKNVKYLKTIKYDRNKYYEIELTLRKVNVTTDNNILFNFQKFKKEKFYEVQHNVITKDKKVDISKEPNINVNFKISAEEQVFYRNYKKLDEIVASCLALYRVIYVFFKVIIKFLNKGMIESFLIAQIFNLNYGDKGRTEEEFESQVWKENKINIEILTTEEAPIVSSNHNTKTFQLIKEIELEVLSPRTSDENIAGKEETLTKKEASLEKKEQSKQVKLSQVDAHFNFSSKKVKDKSIIGLFQNIFSCKVAKNDYIIYESVLRNNLNIINIVKRQLEVELIKKLLFEDELHMCFDVILNRYYNKTSHLENHLMRCTKINEDIQEEEKLVYKREIEKGLSERHDCAYKENVKQKMKKLLDL